MSALMTTERLTLLEKWAKSEHPSPTAKFVAELCAEVRKLKTMLENLENFSTKQGVELKYLKYENEVLKNKLKVG